MLKPQHLVKLNSATKYVLLGMTLLLYANLLMAQPHEVDSLRTILKNAKEDTTRLSIYLKLCSLRDSKNPIQYAEPASQLADKLLSKLNNPLLRKTILKQKAQINSCLGNYYDFDNDAIKSLFYHQKVLSIYTEIKDDEGIINSLLAISNSYRIQGNIPISIEHFQKALLLAQQSKKKQFIANCYSWIGYFYSNVQELPQSIIHYQKCLALYKELKDTIMIASTLTQMGWTSWEMNNFQQSLSWFQEALDLNKKISNTEGTRASYNGLGIAYLANSNFGKALENFETSLAMSEKLPDKTWVRGILGNIGDTYRKQGRIENALKYHYKALEVAKTTDIKSQIGYEYSRLAQDYFMAKEYNKAAQFNNKYIEMSEQVEWSEAKYISDAKLMAVKIDSLTGNYKDAYRHYREYILYRDKIRNEEVKEAAIKEKFQNEYDQQKAKDRAEQWKKDANAKAEIQKQKYRRNAYAVGGIFLLFLTGFLFNRNRIKQRSNIQLKEKNEIITKEKKRSEELLLNILPFEVAEELKQTGGSIAKQYNNVTVLFTDFVNFTSISGQLLPTELVQEIHKSFTAFDAIIEKHGLEKIKTIGDAYLAVCGMPHETPDHAKKVVLAALEIKEYIKQSHSKFQIRVGINSGTVVAGIVGVKKYAYDIWGDTVNTANRMETYSEENKVNISSSTYELVKNDFLCEHRGKINVKGKGEIDMYFVEG